MDIDKLKSLKHRRVMNFFEVAGVDVFGCEEVLVVKVSLQV